MSELLLELYSEEIPARMQYDAEAGFAELFRGLLQEYDIQYDIVNAYSGPCRIIVHITGLPLELAQRKKEVKGPRIDAPAKALEGFCRSNNITQDALVIDEVKGQQVYFYRSVMPAVPLAEFFAQNIPLLLKKYIWPKSMYWGDSDISWVRPLQNICCIFNEEKVSFSYGHLAANMLSFGHKFIGKQQFEVTSFTQLEEELDRRHVIISRQKRQEMILEQINLLCTKHNLLLQQDQGLLQEVVGLVEYPYVILGKMNQEFLAVPAEVLSTAMREHQKFFAVCDQDGNMSPYFVCVSNNPKGDIELITAGNEKVLNARLADAQFFYNEDLKLSLDSLRDKTKNIIFHAKLGSMYDKTERLVALCKALHASEEVVVAARYCKADLASAVVDEFAKLQGLMGGYYAVHHGYDGDTALAISQHYLPASPDDQVPEGEVAFLALADKLDSLLGLYISGERASGSKDPYGLRRLALGIVRLVIANKISHPISTLLEMAASSFSQNIESSQLVELHQFIAERFKYWLKKQGYNTVLLGDTLPDSLLESYDNLVRLEQCFSKEQGKLLAESYKRAANISQFNITQPPAEVDTKFLQEESEKLLYNELEASHAMVSLEFEQQVLRLESLSKLLNKFLDDVLIKHEDQKVASNRRALLHQVCALYHKLCDFSVL